MSTTDARPHAAALKAAIKAALGATANVYDYSTVPGTNGNAGTVPTTFVIVAVERRYNPNLRLTAQAGAVGWRVSARCVASSVTNAGLLLAAVATALNEKRLIVDGADTTPIQFESDQTPALDDGKYSALAIYTYAH
jgi:hypothetical protein